MNPVSNILGNRMLYDSKSRSRTIIHIPINKAYEMRSRGNIFGNMEPKREPYTMNLIEQGILKGNFEPIIATRKEINEGVLSEGKHRILIAKKLGLKTVPVEVVD
jgi:hypothetical protein